MQLTPDQYLLDAVKAKDCKAIAQRLSSLATKDYGNLTEYAISIMPPTFDTEFVISTSTAKGYGVYVKVNAQNSHFSFIAKGNTTQANGTATVLDRYSDYLDTAQAMSIFSQLIGQLYALESGYIDTVKIKP